MANPIISFALRWRPQAFRRAHALRFSWISSLKAFLGFGSGFLAPIFRRAAREPNGQEDIEATTIWAGSQRRDAITMRMASRHAPVNGHPKAADRLPEFAMTAVKAAQYPRPEYARGNVGQTLNSWASGGPRASRTTGIAVFRGIGRAVRTPNEPGRIAHFRVSDETISGHSLAPIAAGIGSQRQHSPVPLERMIGGSESIPAMDSVVGPTKGKGPSAVDSEFEFASAEADNMPMRQPGREDTSSRKHTVSTLHIDGATLGRWALQHLERSLGRPNVGITGIDPRASLPRGRVSPF